MSLPRIGYCVPALALAVLLLAGVPSQAAAPPISFEESVGELSPAQQGAMMLFQVMLFSPQRLVPLQTPPPDVVVPLQVQPPDPQPPDPDGPTDPPPTLQETPEPASALTGLVGSALGALMWWRARRLRKKTESEQTPQS